MNHKENQTKSDQHDHNDRLPKDVLNLEQDPDSFRDPLQQQLEKTGDQPDKSSDSQKGNENNATE